MMGQGGHARCRYRSPFIVPRSDQDPDGGIVYSVVWSARGLRQVRFSSFINFLLSNSSCFLLNFFYSLVFLLLWLVCDILLFSVRISSVFPCFNVCVLLLRFTARLW